MMKRWFTTLLLPLASATLISIAVSAAWGTPCDQTCQFMFGCYYDTSGSSTLNYYHRCDIDHLDCRSYDPVYPDCQKWCQWDEYVCGGTVCRDITAYSEACFTQ
jgi:hypothetical protein